MENTLTNREIAALAWLGAFLLFSLLRAPARHWLRQLLRAVAQPIILVTLVWLGAYVGLVILIGFEVGVWAPNMAKHTLIWLLGPALVLVANTAHVWEEERFFWNTASSTVTVSAGLAVVVNLCILSLPAELVMQPILALLAMASVVAGSRAELRSSKQLIDLLLSFAGIALLVCGISRIARDWGAEGLAGPAGALILPAVLTVAVLPFLYFLALFVAYGSVFAKVKIMTRREVDRWAAIRARVAIVTALHFCVKHVGRVTVGTAREAANAKDFTEAWRAVRRARSS